MNFSIENNIVVNFLFCITILFIVFGYYSYRIVSKLIDNFNGQLKISRYTNFFMQNRLYFREIIDSMIDRYQCNTGCNKLYNFLMFLLSSLSNLFGNYLNGFATKNESVCLKCRQCPNSIPIKLHYNNVSHNYRNFSTKTPVSFSKDCHSTPVTTESYNSNNTETNSDKKQNFSMDEIIDVFNGLMKNISDNGNQKFDTTIKTILNILKMTNSQNKQNCENKCEPECKQDSKIYDDATGNFVFDVKTNQKYVDDNSLDNDGIRVIGSNENFEELMASLMMMAKNFDEPSGKTLNFNNLTSADAVSLMKTLSMKLGYEFLDNSNLVNFLETKLKDGPNQDLANYLRLYCFTRMEPNLFFELYDNCTLSESDPNDENPNNYNNFDKKSS